jgi:hypothetical protein
MSRGHALKFSLDSRAEPAHTFHMKRTTFMVDEALLEEAKTVLGAKNYSETLDKALREAIRSSRVMHLTTYFGTDIWKGDLAEMRRDRFREPVDLEPKPARTRSRKTQASK